MKKHLSIIIIFLVLFTIAYNGYVNLVLALAIALIAIEVITYRLKREKRFNF